MREMKWVKDVFVAALVVFVSTCAVAQNTVGLLSYDPDMSFEGYNLIYPHNQPNVYLLDNCGQIVHMWSDSNQFRPGNTAYLLENGNLVKTKRPGNISNDRIWAGGGGATIEIRSWENELLWSYTINDSMRRMHHDIEVKPDGNILMIVWEIKTKEECLLAGRDTSNLTDGELWPESILEINPETDEIVWEWHAWDHMIQEFDPNQENFGVVANHPELIDVNYDNTGFDADWMHANAIDFNPLLNMIALCVPTFDEIWFIDRTTTTAEAASHSGGLSDIGGDLLYRWGNPQTYQGGDSTDQQLYYPHDVHWIMDHLPNSHPLFGKVAVFNNRVGSDFSTANVFSPLFVDYGYMFQMANDQWLPFDFDETYFHPDTTPLYSTGLSGVQHLPNNNVLICSGRFGYGFELTPSNEIVWEYKTPLLGGNPVEQGTTLGINNNLTFRIHRYPVDYPAFAGRDLLPGDYIELNPNINFCDSLSSTRTPWQQYAISIFPNPVPDMMTISWEGQEKVNLEIFNIHGEPVYSNSSLYGGKTWIDVKNWTNGYYFISINGSVGKAFVIEH